MSLSSRSMYVSLSQNMWQAQTTDRDLAHGVEQKTKAQNRTMRVHKQLVPSEYLLPIKRIATLGRDHHEKLTLPGLQKGQQLLATKLFDEYTLAQAQIKEAFFEEVRRFSDIYPAIVESAPQRLGAAFRPEDFPAPDKIRGFFDYQIRFAPVPESGNWLLDDVDTEELDRLRNEMDNNKNDMFRDATKELFSRTMSVLDNLAAQAKNYVEGQPNGGILRDATINSVKEMADLITNMNITGDPVLNAAAEEMQKKFSSIDATELRHNAKQRKSIHDMAQKIMNKMKAAS